MRSTYVGLTDFMFITRGMEENLSLPLVSNNYGRPSFTSSAAFMFILLIKVITVIYLNFKSVDYTVYYVCLSLIPLYQSISCLVYPIKHNT